MSCMKRRLATLLMIVTALLLTTAAHAQITLPWSEDFEGTNGEIYFGDSPVIHGAPDTRFQTDGAASAVGPNTNTIGAGAYATTPQYLIFNVTAAQAWIEGVYVYAQTAGDVTIRLSDNVGTLIESRTVTITTAATKEFAPLAFLVPNGAGYRLGVDPNGTTTVLYRNTAGSAYPYNGGGVSITGNSFSTGYYYYFYDWQVRAAPFEARLRTDTGYGTGNGAVTMDRATSGNTKPANWLVVELDMSNYSASTDAVELDFSVMNHGEEVDAADNVWIRGTAGFIPVVDLDAVTPSNGVQYAINVDISTALLNASQDFDSTFEIWFGQEDDFPATSSTGTDGFTFDDIVLSLAQVCGNGIPEGSEVCDDGNTNDCDGCRADCSALETGCGDSFLCNAEVCDDGNTTNCDGCRGDCSALETGCGDSYMCGAEACDDGNTADCDGCRADCSAVETGCGDSFLCNAEVCDDGNTVDCDGCRADCSANETGCGDGFTCGAEACDDGNAVDCDGCRADCSVAETGCGDGFMCGTEECDDGNTTTCDGCSDACVTETGCGDGAVCGSELCDDGNTTDCDGCRADCSADETGCGDGFICGTEACDDGNATPGDGCSGTCTDEGAGGSGTGGTGTGNTGGTGTGGSSSDTSTDDGGCGCRVVKSGQPSERSALAMLGLLGLVLLRRRRRAA
jgi:MYXO-CTERM domain-containing protein